MSIHVSGIELCVGTRRWSCGVIDFSRFGVHLHRWGITVSSRGRAVLAVSASPVTLDARVGRRALIWSRPHRRLVYLSGPNQRVIRRGRSLAMMDLAPGR